MNGGSQTETWHSQGWMHLQWFRTTTPVRLVHTNALLHILLILTNPLHHDTIFIHEKVNPVDECGGVTHWKSTDPGELMLTIHFYYQNRCLYPCICHQGSKAWMVLLEGGWPKRLHVSHWDSYANRLINHAEYALWTNAVPWCQNHQNLLNPVRNPSWFVFFFSLMLWAQPRLVII